MTDNLSKKEQTSEKIASIKAQRKLNNSTKHYRVSQNKPLKEAKEAVKQMERAHKEAKNVLGWGWRDWVNLLGTEVVDGIKVAKELITRKKLNELKDNLKKEEKKDKVAEKIFNLTGSLPGEKSGVVKNEEKAGKIVEEHLHKVKISTAIILAYGEDAKLKEKVMKEVKAKYPELVEGINALVKKAREGVNNDEFKKATVGQKFAQNKEKESR